MSEHVTPATALATVARPHRPARPRVTYPLGWLRAVAALSVVTFHAYQFNRTGPEWAWPWSGTAHRVMTGSDAFVDMFFVLSGVVLWLPIAKAVIDGGGGALSGRTLLLRRMARLMPLYVVVVLLVWAFTNPELPGHWPDLLLHLTFTHIYSDDYIFWTNGPAWSLAVEFHFYVLMALAVPLVLAASRRVTTRWARIGITAILPVLCVLTTVAYLGWATVTGQEHTNWSVWFSPLSRASDFGIGMLLAIVVAAGVRLGRVIRGTLALTGLVATVALMMLRPLDTVAGEWWHPLYATTITVGLASIALHDGPWPRLLQWRPLAWIGGLGYGIYLIHEPVMRVLGDQGLLPEPRTGGYFLFTALMVAVPSVLLAWLSSRTIEAGGLRLLRSIERDGSSRDYYPHLDETPQQRRPEPQPV